MTTQTASYTTHSFTTTFNFGITSITHTFPSRRRAREFFRRHGLTIKNIADHTINVAGTKHAEIKAALS